MYEKTVAGIHKVYVATGTGGYASVYDQLSTEAQEEIQDLLKNTGTHQYESHDPVKPHRQKVKRLIVDGYLRYQGGSLLVATSDNPGDDVEVLQQDEIYPTPVVNWVFDTYFNAGAGQQVVVRIFFS